MSLLFAFVFGAFFGSFLNVCALRIPAGESIVWPGSHCFSCRRAIAWYDNIPCLSWFFLGGKCRNCKSKFSFQYPAVEFATGAAIAALYAAYGMTPMFFAYAALTLALIVEGLIDFAHQIIPDSITLPGILAGLGVSAAFPMLHGELNPLAALLHSFLGVIVGGGVLFVTGTVAEKILKKEALGGGDVKLLAMIGAFIGWQGVLWTLFASSFLGSAVGIYLRWSKGAERIPFGPYLGLGAFLYLFFGTQTIEAYLRFLGRG